MVSLFYDIKIDTGADHEIVSGYRVRECNWPPDLSSVVPAAIPHLSDCTCPLPLGSVLMPYSLSFIFFSVVPDLCLLCSLHFQNIAQVED